MQITIFQYLKTKLKSKYIVEKIIKDAFKYEKYNYGCCCIGMNKDTLDRNRYRRNMIHYIYTNRYPIPRTKKNLCHTEFQILGSEIDNVGNKIDKLCFEIKLFNKIINLY